MTPSIVITTPSGNSTPAIVVHTVVDTTPPTLSIDAISGDNVVNAQEHNAPLTITGKTDAENTQSVTVNVNGIDYPGTVTNGIFTATVPASAVGAFTDGQHLNITANVVDQAGNAATPASAALDVDTSATAAADTGSATEDQVAGITHGDVLKNEAQQ